MAALYAIALGIVTVFGLNQFWLAWRYASSRSLRPGPVPEVPSTPPMTRLGSRGVPSSMPPPVYGSARNASPGPGRGMVRPASPGGVGPGSELARPVPPGGVVPGRDSVRPAPMVTVQIPLYNEALVAGRVIAACARLNWPADRMEIQVLDDSTDDTVQVVAEAVRFWREKGLDLIHLRRTHRTGYKAGALASGLNSARGEFIAMFDADFVPPEDFLQRLIPCFDAPSVGLVQARWTHLNQETSLLTELQAMGLDNHFVVEQAARTRSGYPAGFNGTAGIWRRTCIDDAGGWSSDTLTEDLDLSYRAQLKGWTMTYAHDLAVPAELPVEMSGFRAQQHRWTKGAVQTAIKLVPSVVRSRRGAGFRAQGLVHLTANTGFVFMLVLAVLHAPLAWFKQAGSGPTEAYFALLGIGVIGFGGFLGSHVVTQFSLHADWSRRLRRFPLFLAASVGMALSNSVAAMEAVLRKNSPFVRTPKFNAGRAGSQAWWRSAYASSGLGLLFAAEFLLALYSSIALVGLMIVGAWSSVPFQMLFALGTVMVGWFTFRDARLVRRASATRVGSPGGRIQP